MYIINYLGGGGLLVYIYTIFKDRHAEYHIPVYTSIVACNVHIYILMTQKATTSPSMIMAMSLMIMANR